MRTDSRNRKMWTGIICAAALFKIAAAGAAGMAMNETAEDCWNEFKDRLNDCAGILDPVLRENCYNAAVDGIENCLDRLPEDAKKPDDCWQNYLDLLEDCNKHCNTQECKDACARGAQAVFNWCDEVVDFARVGAAPVWYAAPTILHAWDFTYEFNVVTTDPAVESLSFWVVHGSDEGATHSTAYHLGDAQLVAQFDDRAIWRARGHRLTWDGVRDLHPFGKHTAVTIVARAESGGKPVAVSHVVAEIR